MREEGSRQLGTARVIICDSDASEANCLSEIVEDLWAITVWHVKYGKYTRWNKRREHLGGRKLTNIYIYTKWPSNQQAEVIMSRSIIILSKMLMTFECTCLNFSHAT